MAVVSIVMIACSGGGGGSTSGGGGGGASSSGGSGASGGAPGADACTPKVVLGSCPCGEDGFEGCATSSAACLEFHAASELGFGRSILETRCTIVGTELGAGTCRQDARIAGCRKRNGTVNDCPLYEIIWFYGDATSGPKTREAVESTCASNGSEVVDP